MSDELMNFDLPQRKAASIKVIGVGGGGSNAVNHMYQLGIKDVDFIVCNTDVQDLQKSPVPVKVQIGDGLTGGRGAGSNPEVGENAAKESTAELEKLLSDDTQMVFITAGMGGGTGTGAAPVIADISKNLGVLTVGIVTIPFEFEGRKRYEYALRGIEALSQNVDSMLIINNETLREKFGNLKITEAFAKADDVLTIAAKGIAEIITVNGVINVDFEDVRTVMKDSGVSIMASGSASGENRAFEAIEETLDSPLLNKADIRGAKNILLNFTSGKNEITMDEITIVTNYIIQKAERDVNIIWGYVKNEELDDEIGVTLIATGFEMNSMPEFKAKAPITINELGKKSSNQIVENKIVSTLAVDEPRPLQTEINWEQNSPIQAVPQQKIRLMNDDSMFKGKLHDEPQSDQTTVAFDYEKVRKMDDITQFEKEPAYLRKKRANNPQNDEEEVSENPDYSKPSRFSIDENAEGIYLSDNNKYLDHNAD
ncbi:MAG: cell division protein FtsZ [Bacteroidales bacterium]|nr:cell division protein FtsZ [Bacteroidales bacterium]NLK81127.1 cell division protein FtsZ [Bacteroidales bacterium]HPY81912.1 cell division protein FtsZ [Bacteroidales bacterium]